MKDKDSPSTSVKDALATLEGLEHLRALISQASREIDQITRECDVGALALHFYNAPEPKTVEFLNKHGIEWIAPRNGHGFTLVFANRSALNAFYEQGGLIAVAQMVKPGVIALGQARERSRPCCWSMPCTGIDETPQA